MPPPAVSMRRDIASAYLVVACRIGGLLLVSAVVYRRLGAEAFAAFSLIRAMLGLLTYTGLGLAPAMVRMLAEAAKARATDPAVLAAPALDPLPIDGSHVLSYEPRPARVQWVEPRPVVRVFVSGQGLALIFSIIGFLAAGFYAQWAPTIHGFSAAAVPGAGGFAFGLGAAVVLRLLSEPTGSILQVRGRQALDNLYIAAAEAAAASAAVVALGQGNLRTVGICYALAGVVLLVARMHAAARLAPELFVHSRPHWPTQRALLGFGSLVTLAQLADFLYAPTDYLLINWLLTLQDVAVYAPAVQVDAGLLTLVTGLATVLLPKTALAHAAGEANAVRQFYLRGTVASAVMLLLAAVIVLLLSPWIFRLWLGDDLPATRAILPLVLIATVVGGSGAVGRSVLLGMGKVKPFTTSVLVAGVGNVVLSYVFVRYVGLGLKGIVLGTIVVVVARAGIWMPWYVLRTLREHPPASAGHAPTPGTSAPSRPTSG